MKPTPKHSGSPQALQFAWVKAGILLPPLHHQFHLLPIHCHSSPFVHSSTIPSSLAFQHHAHPLCRAPDEVTCGFWKPIQWLSPIPHSSPSSRASPFFCTFSPSSFARAFVYYGAFRSSDSGGLVCVASPMLPVKACVSIFAAFDYLYIVLLSPSQHG
jgi:hypothetical protein